MMSKSASVLVKSVADVMVIIIQVFTQFSFKINFAKGKTECLLKLRGKHSVEEREKLQSSDGLVFKLPAPYEKEVLRVVDHYKHLGSVVCLSESLMYDAQHRSTSALCSYTSLAGRVFGSRCIGSTTKLHLMASLILSRLLFGTQMWSGNFAEPMRKINIVYMKVLRKIIGDSHFGKGVHSDPRVRELLK